MELRLFNVRTLERLAASDRLINYPRTAITQRREKFESFGGLAMRQRALEN